MMFSTTSSAYKTICPVWSSLYLNGATSISYSVFFQVQRWEHIVDGSLKYKISPCDPSDWIPVLNEGHAEQSGGCELNMRMKRRIFSKRQNVYGLVMKIIFKGRLYCSITDHKTGHIEALPIHLVTLQNAPTSRWGPLGLGLLDPPSQSQMVWNTLSRIERLKVDFIWEIT